MKLLVLGDVHGDVAHIKFAVKKAIAHQCDQIIQLGDFGYFPDTPDGDRFLDAIANPPIPIYWLDGNHDNHERLDHAATSPVEIRPGVFYLPRAYRWQVGGQILMALGGAYSIDRNRRTPGIDFWDAETLSYADIARAIAEPVDILLCHDCPSAIDISVVCQCPATDIAPAESNRRMLQEVVDQCRPKRVFHGHYHAKHMTEEGDVLYVGLNCNHKPDNSWSILEL